MSRKGIELVDDLKVIASVDLVRGKDAVFAVDFEDGDRDHQVAGKLERVGLCKRKVVRHIEGSISGAGQFPIDGVLAQGRISSSAGHFCASDRKSGSQRTYFDREIAGFTNGPTTPGSSAHS